MRHVFSGRPLVFRLFTEIELPAHLAALLMQGGAYRKPKHPEFRVDWFMSDPTFARFASPEEAFAAVAQGFLDGLTDGNIGRIWALWSVRGWSRWFLGFSWDYTLLLIDPAKQSVWLLCTTDTD